MHIFKLILKNALRHKLRTSLTVLGLVIAILSFGILQTVVDAWYAGADAASSTRLITRNSISLVFPLPVTYQSKIRAVDGVTQVATSNWFGGIYQDPKNFFAQFAVSHNYLDLYPEFVLSENERAAFLRDRKACIVGRKLANQYGFKIGDVIPIKGTIFPGQWEFVVRGIYEGKQPTTDASQLLFHWEYLNEFLQKNSPRRANQVGIYVIQIDKSDNAAAVSETIDKQFKNSLAETLTETEKAFQLGFVAMSEAIVMAIRTVSFVVIVIIMAVMANTMAMSARERISEYATLKALGFGPGFVTALIFGESLLIAFIGAGLGIGLLFPAAHGFREALGKFFPVFNVSSSTLMLQAASAVVIGFVAAIAPALRSAKIKIVEGLRSIG